ncbi:MAG: hypothetical protein VB064_00730 [Oscillospiraceae bacterium]|nr:hypothetical protein [Oscillospiraceae bacterium]
MMIKNKKIAVFLASVLILAVGVGVGAYAASNFGTQADPLVAKSYLDQTVTPNLQAQFQAKLDEQVQLMEQQITSTTTGLNFKAVSLSSGQTLTGSVGCEIILRSGTADCSGSAGLSDVTDGKLISVGSALTANHLCMVGTDGDGVKAGSSVTLLVRGGYSIK